MSAGGAQARLLTASGVGAISVIRLTGPDARSILARVFRPAGHTADEGRPRRAHDLFGDDRLRYGHLLDGKEVIDDVVVARVGAAEAASYHISAHGGVRVVERILGLLQREGVQMHTREVPLWTCKNLIEREAVEALERARTARAVRFLATQRRRLVGWFGELIERHDADPVGVERDIQVALDRYRGARHLVSGAKVALIGPPNSGKSTLFNRLVGRSAAVVSGTAGTTRDWVTGEVELGGVPITLMDTAGQRIAVDDLERQAVDFGRSISQSADLRILVLDGSSPLPRESIACCSSPDGRAADIVAVNKADLPAAWDLSEFVQREGSSAGPWASLSALTGDRIERLEGLILAALGVHDLDETAPTVFTARQFEQLKSITGGNHAAKPAVFAREIRRLIGRFSDDGL